MHFNYNLVCEIQFVGLPMDACMFVYKGLEHTHTYESHTFCNSNFCISHDSKHSEIFALIISKILFIVFGKATKLNLIEWDATLVRVEEFFELYIVGATSNRK